MNKKYLIYFTHPLDSESEDILIGCIQSFRDDVQKQLITKSNRLKNPIVRKFAKKSLRFTEEFMDGRNNKLMELANNIENLFILQKVDDFKYSLVVDLSIIPDLENVKTPLFIKTFQNRLITIDDNIKHVLNEFTRRAGVQYYISIE